MVTLDLNFSFYVNICRICRCRRVSQELSTILEDKMEYFLLAGLSVYIYTAVCYSLIGINNVELRIDELKKDELSKLCSAFA
jgi:hypothetical protein